MRVSFGNVELLTIKSSVQSQEVQNIMNVKSKLKGSNSAFKILHSYCISEKQIIIFSANQEKHSEIPFHFSMGYPAFTMENAFTVQQNQETQDPLKG